MDGAPCKFQTARRTTTAIIDRQSKTTTTTQGLPTRRTFCRRGKHNARTGTFPMTRDTRRRPTRPKASCNRTASIASAPAHPCPPWLNVFAGTNQPTQRRTTTIGRPGPRSPATRARGNLPTTRAAAILSGAHRPPCPSHLTGTKINNEVTTPCPSGQRGPLRKRLGSARVGSNPTGVAEMVCPSGQRGPLGKRLGSAREGSNPSTIDSFPGPMSAEGI